MQRGSCLLLMAAEMLQLVARVVFASHGSSVDAGARTRNGAYLSSADGLACKIGEMSDQGQCYYACRAGKCDITAMG